MFPSFQEQCGNLYTLLLPVSIVLLVAGLVGALQHCQSPRSMLRALCGTMCIVITIAFFGEWTDLAKDALQSVASRMDANPERAAQRYSEVLTAREIPGQKEGWFGLPGLAQIFEALLWAVLSFVGLIAQFIIWAAYIVQQFLVGLSYAFAPLFLGLLALRSTCGIGIRYIMGICGILAWPLGWAAASIGTSNLIDVATEQGLVVISNVYGTQTMLAGATIGGWIILSTLLAPVIIQHAVSTGAQIGGALLGGVLSTGTAMALTGAKLGASLAAAGASGKASAGAAAGAGAVSSSVKSAVQPAQSVSAGGRTGTGSSAPIQAGGGSGSSNPSSEGSPEQHPPAAGAGFNPKDPAWDNEVRDTVPAKSKASNRP
jgi:hypothetical protein